MQTLQFGIIGLGHFGKHYARLLQEIPGVKLLATADTPSEAEGLINNKNIDAVIIATPASTHAEIIARSLRAGKHVLVEKPMVISTAEAKAVEKELKKNKDLVFMVGFQYIYNDYISFLKQLVDRGGLGKISYVVAENLYFGPIRPDISCFGDAGVHELSILEYLLNTGKIVSVSRHDFGVSFRDADYVEAVIAFENGCRARISTSWFVPEKSRKMMIVGDKGIAIFNDSQNEKLRIYRRPYPAPLNNGLSDFMKELSEIPPEVPEINAGEPLKNEVEHFLDCVRTKAQPITGFKFGELIVANSARIMV